jgi:hypothetical protein
LSDGQLQLAVEPGSNQVRVNWSADGGCAPFTGTIRASYETDSSPYRSYAVRETSGTIVDQPPRRCDNTAPLVYTLTLVDAERNRVSDTARTAIRWSCPTPVGDRLRL